MGIVHGLDRSQFNGRPDRHRCYRLTKGPFNVRYICYHRCDKLLTLVRGHNYEAQNSER